MMANVKVSINKETYKTIQRNRGVNWSALATKAIIQRLARLSVRTQ